MASHPLESLATLQGTMLRVQLCHKPSCRMFSYITIPLLEQDNTVANYK